MNQVVSQDVVEKAILNPLQDQTCSDFHPAMSCNQKAFSQFLIGSKSVAKMYLMVHLVPFLLFKRKQTKNNPKKEILKLLIGFIKSILFAGGYTALVRRTVCFICQHFRFVGYSNSLGAIVSSVTLNFQPVSRQSQIALYTVNKTMQVCYKMARRRGWPVKLPFGQGILLGVALCLICFSYVNNPESIRGSYRAVLDKLLSNI